VNNDGYDDILLGADNADNNGGVDAGDAYLILGRSLMSWNSLTNDNGDFSFDDTSDANLTVRFIGRDANDEASGNVSGAGDVNNDGFDDILIGSLYAAGGGTDSGEAYLILGRSTANWATLTDASGDFNLDNLSDANLTVRFIGRNAADFAGKISGAGDVDDDSYADLLIGADKGDRGGADAGEAYLIRGRSTTDWASLTDASGNYDLEEL
jgi:hypothetical protein